MSGGDAASDTRAVTLAPAAALLAALRRKWRSGVRGEKSAPVIPVRGRVSASSVCFQADGVTGALVLVSSMKNAIRVSEEG
jgi:hypothetical protein